MEYFKWKHLIGQHLGQKVSRRSWQLMLDLHFVECGLKPALLLDFAVASASSVGSLLDALRSAGVLTAHLTVVTVGADVVIVNPECFSGLRDCSGDPFPGVRFVDVSGRLDHPQLLLGSSGYLQQTKNCFFTVLERMDSVTSLDVPMETWSDRGANPSTLFGLFLSYPVVYYYDMKLGSEANCLSMVPLVNFVVKGTVAESEGRGQQTREHVVYSFSVPQSLASVVERRVEAWFQERRDRGQRCRLLGELHLERRVVELPSVCL